MNLRLRPTYRPSPGQSTQRRLPQFRPAKLPSLTKWRMLQPSMDIKAINLKGGRKFFSSAGAPPTDPTKPPAKPASNFRDFQTMLDTRRVVHYKVDVQKVPGMLKQEHFDPPAQPAPDPFQSQNKQERETLENLGDLFSDTEGQMNTVSGYTDTSFLIGESLMEGAIIVFNDAIFGWNVKKLSDVTPESLSIFGMHHPTPQLLILGTGPTLVRMNHILEHFLKQGIVVEFLDTPNAVATWNFCLQEGREAAAAFLTARLPE